jgi:hypothetical protein
MQSALLLTITTYERPANRNELPRSVPGHHRPKTLEKREEVLAALRGEPPQYRTTDQLNRRAACFRYLSAQVFESRTSGSVTDRDLIRRYCDSGHVRPKALV